MIESRLEFHNQQNKGNTGKISNLQRNAVQVSVFYGVSELKIILNLEML